MAAMAALQQQQRNAIERPIPPTLSPMRLPPSSMANVTNAASLGLPLLSGVGVPSSLAAYHNSLTSKVILTVILILGPFLGSKIILV